MFFQFQKLARFFSCDIGIDLGTANFLVYMKDRGIVISEPSVVAFKTKTNEVMAVGTEAKRMLSRVPQNIAAIRPMKYGVIADFKVTEAMLRHFIRRIPMQAESHTLLSVTAAWVLTTVISTLRTL